MFYKRYTTNHAFRTAMMILAARAPGLSLSGVFFPVPPGHFPSILLAVEITSV